MVIPLLSPRPLAFFWRNFGQCTQDIKIKCYQTYIWPICEYDVPSGHPTHALTFTKLRWSIGRLPDLYLVITHDTFVLQIHCMLNQLNWQSLERRRDESTLVMFHKIINQYVDIPSDHNLHNVPCITRSSYTKCLHLLSGIDSFMYSFFPRAIQLWNHLATWSPRRIWWCGYF